MINARTAAAGQQYPGITNPAIVRGAGLGLDLKPLAQTQAQNANFAAENPNARPDQTALVAAGLPNDANVSVDRSVRGALATQNNPGATPATVQAVSRGIDPLTGQKEQKGIAAKNLYKEMNPGASEAELEAARLGVIKVDEGMTSTFTPNQMLGGGVISQKDKMGNITVTPVNPDGSYGKSKTMPRPDTPGKVAAITPVGEAGTRAQAPSPSAAGRAANGIGSPKSVSVIQEEASQAVQAGVPVAAVNARLKEYGLPPISARALVATPNAAPVQGQPNAQSLPARIAKASSDPHAFSSLAYEAQQQLPGLLQRIQSAQQAVDSLPPEAQKIMQQAIEHNQRDAQMYQSILDQQSARTGLPN